MNESKLRIGLLIDQYQIPNWLYQSIYRVNQLNSADITSVFLIQRNQAFVKKIRKHKEKGTFLYRLFKRYDEIFFRKKRRPDAFIFKDIRDYLPGHVREISLKPLDNALGYEFDESSLRQVKAENVDILIRACASTFVGHILKGARYGIWSHYHADNRRVRGEPHGFWESVEAHPATGSILEILGDKPGEGKVIFRSWSTTVYQSPSVNRNYAYWTSSSFLARQIDRLYYQGEEKFSQAINKLNKDHEFYIYKTYEKPNNLQALRIISIYLYRMFWKAVDNRFYWNQWFLMYNLDPNSANSIHQYKRIEPPEDEFWADPHVMERGGIYYIYFEIYSCQTGRGHISVLEMDKQGNYKKPVDVLRKDYHLSYPFIVEQEDKLYMIPETKENGTIELYECVEFPHKWEFKMNLMENIQAVDATPFFHQGKWWLFACITETEGARSREELYLFYADELLTQQWTPHPLNPVVSDVKVARPAGKLFEKNGKIFRPSQDCSNIYGYGININEITCLTETDYEEHRVNSIVPSWDKRADGAHTYSREGDLTIIDCLEKRWRPLGSN